MALSRRTSDLMAPLLQAREPYVWLKRYFDAEDREVIRCKGLAVRLQPVLKGWAGWLDEAERLW